MAQRIVARRGRSVWCRSTMMVPEIDLLEARIFFLLRREAELADWGRMKIPWV